MELEITNPNISINSMDRGPLFYESIEFTEQTAFALSSVHEKLFVNFGLALRF